MMMMTRTAIVEIFVNREQYECYHENEEVKVSQRSTMNVMMSTKSTNCHNCNHYDYGNRFVLIDLM